MKKAKRSIIQIDEEKCTGCGLCIPSCPEGALKIVDGKARLVKENFCDGLGACLGDCPEEAMTIIEEEVESYDEQGVIAHIKENTPEMLEKHLHHIKENKDKLEEMGISIPESVFLKDTDSSPLRQWPIQIHLVSPIAPFLKNKEVVVAADCVPYAYPEFHNDLLRDKILLIGCPKLDDTGKYEEKISEMIKRSEIVSITVLFMEVPCCYGLVTCLENAISLSGRNIPFYTEQIGIQGEKKGSDHL